MKNKITLPPEEERTFFIRCKLSGKYDYIYDDNDTQEFYNKRTSVIDRIMEKRWLMHRKELLSTPLSFDTGGLVDIHTVLVWFQQNIVYLWCVDGSNNPQIICQGNGQYKEYMENK